MIGRVAILLLVVLVAGCNAGRVETISDPATAPVRVSPAEAARVLSGMRAARGLSAVSADATLNRIAQDYANRLAAADELRHDLGGSLEDRLADGGYVWVVAAENLGAGYRSLTEAFERWEASPSHRANLYATAVEEIGIATAFNGDSRFRNFWVLVLASPRDR